MQNAECRGPSEGLRWISTEERLPEAGEQVLAVCELGVREAWYLGVNGWWRLAIGISTRGVPEWMPMPTEQTGVHWEPRTRLEQIRCMSLEELAERLLTLHDGDAGSYCRMKAECVAALEENRPEEITDQHCLECVKEWLMEEV